MIILIIWALKWRGFTEDLYYRLPQQHYGNRLGIKDFNKSSSVRSLNKLYMSCVIFFILFCLYGKNILEFFLVLFNYLFNILFFQDETASVSSRSQGPESEAGDPQEQNEDTPQPSGKPTPNQSNVAIFLSLFGKIG